jgi:hypothetical protein
LCIISICVVRLGGKKRPILAPETEAKVKEKEELPGFRPY